MRNHWIRNTWKLEIVKTDLVFPNDPEMIFIEGPSLKFIYGPYEEKLWMSLKCVSDLRDANGISVTAELACLVAGALQFQTGLANSHHRFQLSVDDRIKLHALFEAVHNQQPYDHFLS